MRARVTARAWGTRCALAGLTLLLVLSVPSGAAQNASVTAPTPTLSHPVAPAVGPSVAPSPTGSAGVVHAQRSTAPGAPRAHVHPLVTCPPMYPTWGALGNWLPVSPAQTLQSPCPWIGMDEQHLTYSSQVGGSGTNFRMPLYLPTDPASNQSSSMFNFYIGMVVSGDVHSEWHQSYAELNFAPNGGGSWNEGLAVYSLVNQSYFGRSACPALNFTWNNSYFCEIDDWGGGMGSNDVSVPGGSWLNVTFNGSIGGTVGLRIWSNDSTASGYNVNYTLNPAGEGSSEPDGNHTFEPAFAASCRDSCYLKWGMGYGLGIGTEPCPDAPAPFSACDSYNQYTWLTNPPIGFGIPHYMTGGSYVGDYRWLAPESASGECNTLEPPGVVTGCYNQQGNGGSGYYPVFTFNGSQINWGTNWSWTTDNFGAFVGGEYRSDGFAQDIVPMALDEVTNDSQAGFILSGAALNVSVRLQDVGEISTATLHYQIGNGAFTDLAMSRIAGTASLGIYNVTIPVGPDGWITYSITGLGAAGSSVNSTAWHVKRGPFPTFTVELSTSPPGCGRVWFNGSAYHTGQSVQVHPGFYELQGSPCYPSVFYDWNVTSGVALAGQPAKGPQYALAAISANASVQGVWKYVRPHDAILVLTNPGVCGSVALNGSVIGNGTTVSMLDQENYSLQVGSSCAQKSFAGWTVTGGPLDVLGSNFEPFGNGTLTANFVSSSASDQVVFYTAPTNCGGVLFRGAGYVDQQSIAILPGTYPVAGDPCAHFGFRNFSVSSNLALSGSNVTVNGVGWIRETNEHLTEIHVETNPASCGTVSIDGTNYTNGAVDVVANNTTHTAYGYPCSGYSLFALSGSGGLSLFGNVVVANGSGTLLAVFQYGPARSFVAFITNPSSCGTIAFEGVHYRSSQYTYVAPGTVATLGASPCANYGFVRWTTSGDITVVGGNAYINGTIGGSITATFTPLVTVYLYTSPAACGTVTLAGVSYFDNESVELAQDAFYGLTAQPCQNYTLGGWVNSTSATIEGSQVYLAASAVITAVFVPVRFTVTVLLTPPSCGQAQIGTAHVSNGTVLSLGVGNYNLSTTSCLGFQLLAWNASGGITIAGNVLTVAGAGTLSGAFGPIPPAVAISAVASTFAGDAVLLTATVADPVPPYNYTYAWTFGDGAVGTTPANFTTHVYGSAGTYTVHVTITDPYHRTASASQTVVVLPTSGSSLGLPAVVWIAIGAVLAIAAVLVIGSLWRRPPPPEPDDAAPLPAAPSTRSLPAGGDGSESTPPQP